MGLREILNADGERGHKEYGSLESFLRQIKNWEARKMGS